MIKNNFFDDLETRSVDERNSDHLEKINNLIKVFKLLQVKMKSNFTMDLRGYI